VQSNGAIEILLALVADSWGGRLDFHAIGDQIDAVTYSYCR
jgi:hypothetical protein